MSLFAVARRAAVTAGRRAALSLSPIPLRAPLEPPAVARFIAPMSSSSVELRRRDTWDAELLRVLDYEIKCAEETDDHDRVEDIPEGFPFEIKDEEGLNIITLTRTSGTEKIEVVVAMPSLVTGDQPDQDKTQGQDGEKRKEDDDDEDEEEVGEEPEASSLPITVTVSKGSGPCLEFCCTAYPDEIVINSLSVKEESPEEEALPYEGPDFNDLDKNLQLAFHKYLDLRGVSPLTTNFLHEYMINKDSREYLHWLRRLKKFVKP